MTLVGLLLRLVERERDRPATGFAEAAVRITVSSAADGATSPLVTASLPAPPFGPLLRRQCELHGSARLSRVRVLSASTRGVGHFNPLVPFADACVRLGHEVLVAGPPSLAGAVESVRHQFWVFDYPLEDELAEVWARVPSLPPDEANAVVIGEIFARLDATASLPRLREACRHWKPDVVVRESNEYGSAVAAEVHGIAHVRVGIGLSRMEELALRCAADALDTVRGSVGLSSDPAARALRRSPYLTLFLGSFEDLDEGSSARCALREERAREAHLRALILLVVRSSSRGQRRRRPLAGHHVVWEGVSKPLIGAGRPSDPGAVTCTVPSRTASGLGRLR